MQAALETNKHLFYLVPLIKREDLKDACIKLLNQEWPRSEAARANSMSKSTSEIPPMSLLLLEKQTNRLVGHARICNVLDDSFSCYIESVIIDREFRNKGVGRLLMHLVEETAITLGFSKAYLCTKDKQKFYTKCGYQFCDPVVYVGCAKLSITNSLIRKTKDLSLKHEKSELESSFSQTKALPSVKTEIMSPPSAPPPPPIPPPDFLKFKKVDTVSETGAKNRLVANQYLCKKLV